MKRMVLLLALLPCTPLSQAQEPTAEPDGAALEQQMCAETECQRDLRVVLKQRDGGIYDKTFAAFPATVQAFGVTVVAGQTVYVEAELDGNRLTNYHAVAQLLNPKITITAKLEQMEDGGMMLTLHNPFDKALKFDMGIMPLESDGLYKTSSCPIIARGNSFEMWPYPIFQLVLGNGRLLGPGDKMVCAE